VQSFELEIDSRATGENETAKQILLARKCTLNIHERTLCKTGIFSRREILEKYI
jgi:hypothetical protein